MNKYLASTKYINWEDPKILTQAEALAKACSDPIEIARNCFEYVRDEIKHSWDFRLNPVTCIASDVLKYGTGYCYAKSHLLAALLRANGIPSGLCYQRLSVGDSGSPYCLHGLNAVFLKNYGWYRCDARGNKTGVNAQFTPPNEVLAFQIRQPEECDVPEIWAVPLPVITEVLETCPDVAEVHANLPDITLLTDKTLQRTQRSIACIQLNHSVMSCLASS